MDPDVVIIGAGVAGLECARSLREAGLRSLVLERSRGVGGRCATRRMEGQPVDHGVGFFHGDDPRFLDALRSTDDDDRLEGWPLRIEGHGTPCQPLALAPAQRRVAFRSGMTAFAKTLSERLPIELSARVERLGSDVESIRVVCEDGREHRARHVVLAMAAAQATRLLAPIAEESRELRAAVQLLEMVGSARCMTVIADYGPQADRPEWDMWFPEQSRLLQAVSHDSAKRGQDARLVLVYQALPGWSRQHWDDDEASWSQALLDEAAHLIGAWADTPATVQAHRWKFCRADTVDEFAGPMLISSPGGARIGIAGEVFAPGGGVQAAWLSGRMLAERLLHEVHA